MDSPATGSPTPASLRATRPTAQDPTRGPAARTSSRRTKGRLTAGRSRGARTGNKLRDSRDDPGRQGGQSQSGADSAPGANQVQGAGQPQTANQAEAAKQTQAANQAQVANQPQPSTPPRSAQALAPDDPSAPNSQRAGARPGDAFPNKSPARAVAPPEQPRSEQALSLDQWLRGIPEDSGELLRRKFMIEHMMKQQGSQP